VEELSRKLAKANDEVERQIAEQFETEGKVRALSYRLIKAQEEERRRIGQEVHDTMGGAITLLNLTLHKMEAAVNEPARPLLEEINEIVDELADEVSMLSGTLRPPVLDELGLAAALESYFELYTRRASIRVNFGQDGAQGHFPEAVETAAYRIVQEALTNVARHAGVNEVKVTLEADIDVLRVRIEDQGCGFDPEKLARESSGILGMEDRAFLAGGTLAIESSPGNGTVITCDLPLWL
jgi:signal transduction histidine kinase